ncbi:MAG TPA: pyrroloquinoline quinone biosynthesis peptide chaperone PqqD [Stellaceae bacterium]|jgi:pyrroloquinoline quinone biosynthesis protein D|nr:pyrroloquinoline quinone biosynthesis peptide chaperone PqqD [Stellaceae bacterium]
MSGVRLIVEGATVLRFPPHVKFRFDPARDRWVVLAPERLLLPDDLSVEILQQIDGTHAVDDIVDALMVKFSAQREEISVDVTALLQDLADKGTLVP